jgi:hypothetical protein
MRILAILIGLLAFPAVAFAQRTDYSAGKTPAQLFAGDCAACHKSPRGLTKQRDARALTAFLREHYTTKIESAGALAAYLLGNPGPAVAEGRKKPEAGERGATERGPAERGQESRETRGEDQDSRAGDDIVVPEGTPRPPSHEAAKKLPRTKGKKPTAAELAREAAKAAEEQKTKITDYANAGEQSKPLEAAAGAAQPAVTAPVKPEPDAPPPQQAAPATPSPSPETSAQQPAPAIEPPAPAAESKPPADEKPATTPPG